MRTNLIAQAFTVGLLTAAAAFGQGYPNKPVRIVASEAGGGNDFVARQIAPGLTTFLGQQVIIDNRALVAPEVVQKAPADGYTLLIGGSQFWLLPFLRDKVSYDPVRDFTPISLAVTSPGILVVHSSLPVHSVKELIALAKAKPGQLNYAMGALGAIPHLGAELFKSMAGVNIMRIPYKGNAAALNDLIAGNVQMMIASAGNIAQHVTSGRLRALAVTTAKPSALYPNLPTVAATLQGYEAATFTAVFAPKGTPEAIIRRLNQGIVQSLNNPDVKQRFASAAVEVIASTPEELGTKVNGELARLGKVIKDAGIHED
jgi:tripartite-type tricarboxylate transporter receptor subunit TctC